MKRPVSSVYPLEAAQKSVKTVALDGIWQLSGDFSASVQPGVIQMQGRKENEVHFTRVNVPANVPGYVQTALQTNGLLGDTNYRYNEIQSISVGLSQWRYDRSFTVSDSDLISFDAADVILDGVDTISQVFINNFSVGITENMFRQYSFNVKEFLQVGENTIAIVISNPEEYASQKAQQYGYPVPTDQYRQDHIFHKSFIRKTPCHFGWNWGPAMLPIGIYRSVSLNFYSHPRIVSVTQFQTHHQSNNNNNNNDRNQYLSIIDIRVCVFVNAATQQSDGFLRAVLNDSFVSDTVAFTLQGEGEHQICCDVNNVEGLELWFPIGLEEFGSPVLHSLLVEILDPSGSTVVDSKTMSIGLRTMEVVQEIDDPPVVDENGIVAQSFYFRVNGYDVFAKGSDWVPMDSFTDRITPERLNNILDSAVDVHTNMIRVWGGGQYESDAFYDECDKRGIMIWQDFMFACGMNAASEEFLQIIAEEVKYQIRRLQHRPSVAIWCGNNENEQALTWYEQSRSNRDRYLVDYTRLFESTIRGVASKEDSSRFYWASSPSNGQQVWGNPNNPSRGDTHHWPAWVAGAASGWVDPSTGQPIQNWRNGFYTSFLASYLKLKPRFINEFGAITYPSYETMVPFMDKQLGDFNFLSPQMEFRMRANQETIRCLGQVGQNFRLPVGVDAFQNTIYLHQVTQALILKVSTEHFRRLKPYCRGVVYWQLNDIWPGASLSSLNYDGRWKAMHHFARIFFAPLLISGIETYIQTPPTNPADYPEKFQVWATSDMKQSVSDTAIVKLWRWSDSIAVVTWEVDFQLLADENKMILELDVAEDLFNDVNTGCSRSTCSISLEFRNGHGGMTATELKNSYFFVAPKQMELPKATITISNASLISNQHVRLTLQSDLLAMYVYLSSGIIKGKFSLNYFQMYPALPITVDFYGWNETDFTLETFLSNFKTTSVVNTYHDY